MEKYLTEQSLGDFLNEKIPGNWIHDKPFLGRFKPDYRNENRKLIVEFDGYAHYTQAYKILSDMAKDELYINSGYAVVRIPYFIQLSDSVCLTLFNRNITTNQVYPHGFIDKKCILPADFCEAGIKKFKQDLDRFSIEKPDIIKSLKDKISSSKYGIQEVLPKSLEYLIN